MCLCVYICANVNECVCVCVCLHDGVEGVTHVELSMVGNIIDGCHIQDMCFTPFDLLFSTILLFRRQNKLSNYSSSCMCGDKEGCEGGGNKVRLERDGERE